MFQFPNKNDNYLFEDITKQLNYGDGEEAYSRRYKFGIYPGCIHEASKYIDKNSKLMDAGPGGLGYILGYFSNVLNYTVYATDLKNKNKKLNKIKNLIYKKESLLDTKYKKDFFDVIFCISVIEHMDPEKLQDFFKEMHRILKPNGKLILSTVEIEWNYKKEIIEKSDNNVVQMDYIKTIENFDTIKAGNYVQHPELTDKNVYFNKRVGKIGTEYCCILNNKE